MIDLKELRERVEEMMIRYGTECYAEGKTQKATDQTQATGAILMRAIDDLLACAEALSDISKPHCILCGCTPHVDGCIVGAALNQLRES